MRDRRPARSLWGALVLTLAACDSTVGLDSTKLSFSRVLVPGACEAPDSEDLQYVEMSVMLLDDEDALLPEDRVRGERGRVGDLLSQQDFRFVEAPAGVDPSELQGKQGLAVSDPQNQNNVSEPVAMRPDDLRFLWNGGEERKRDRRLVVLLMDQSGSLIGQDPLTNEVIISRASDLNDEHILFFRDLVGSLPDEDYISLVPFNGTFPDLNFKVRPDAPPVSEPTRNRDIILEGLDRLGVDQPTGGTPLADALDQVLTRIIDFEGNADLNPVVVVFTDGVEQGDTSPSTTLDEVMERYANRTLPGDDGTPVPAPVPVVMVHLQVPAAAALEPLNYERGRNPAYAEIACRSTGEYIFVQSASEFTANPDLTTIVRNRLRGTWRLRAQTDLPRDTFTPGGYLLTSELSVTLGGNTASAPMALSRDPSSESRDTRLWFHKR